MKNGQELVTTLETNNSSRWVIIHGHLHAPMVYTAQGTTANTPVVISSGSLGSPLYDSLLEQTGNQFHLLEFATSHFNNMGLVGSLQSWEWGGARKWYSPDRPYPGHQHYSGFGNTTQIKVLTQTILNSMNESIIRGESIDTLFPMLKFTTPGDLQALKLELKNHNIGLQLEKGKVLEIGKGVQQ